MTKQDIDKSHEKGKLLHTVFARQIELVLEQVQLKNVDCFGHPWCLMKCCGCSKGNLQDLHHPEKFGKD